MQPQIQEPLCDHCRRRDSGSGKGRRLWRQEPGNCVKRAKYISGKENMLLFSIGSDGTDGPTDAAGGIVDGNSQSLLMGQGISIDEVLLQNDSYHALEKINGLIKTGATGTNVNDVTVLLKR